MKTLDILNCIFLGLSATSIVAGFLMWLYYLLKRRRNFVLELKWKKWNWFFYNDLKNFDKTSHKSIQSSAKECLLEPTNNINDSKKYNIASYVNLTRLNKFYKYEIAFYKSLFKQMKKHNKSLKSSKWSMFQLEKNVDSFLKDNEWKLSQIFAIDLSLVFKNKTSKEEATIFVPKNALIVKCIKKRVTWKNKISNKFIVKKINVVSMNDIIELNPDLKHKKENIKLFNVVKFYLETFQIIKK